MNKIKIDKIKIFFSLLIELSKLFLQLLVLINFPFIFKLQDIFDKFSCL